MPSIRAMLRGDTLDHCVYRLRQLSREALRGAAWKQVKPMKGPIEDVKFDGYARPDRPPDISQGFVDEVSELGGDLREIRSLASVRLHDLRHSFASFAIADGAPLFLVGKVPRSQTSTDDRDLCSSQRRPLEACGEQNGLPP